MFWSRFFGLLWSFLFLCGFGFAVLGLEEASANKLPRPTTPAIEARCKNDLRLFPCVCVVSCSASGRTDSFCSVVLIIFLQYEIFRGSTAQAVMRTLLASLPGVIAGLRLHCT